MAEPADLVLVSGAARMLAEAQSVDEIRRVIDLAETARLYASKARLGLQAQNAAAAISIEAQARAAEALDAARRAGELRGEGGNQRPLSQPETVVQAPTLADIGIDGATAHRWASVARVAPSTRSEYVQRATADGDEVSRAGLLRYESTERLAPLMSSGTDEWYTPRHVIGAALSVLGAIDLDPCSDPGPDFNVPAAERFTAEHDGLARGWRGRVWMNPPYSRAAEFCAKLAEEFAYGNVPAALALVPARTDTAWFRSLGAADWCFLSGRLRFLTPGGEAPNSATFPSAVAYLGQDRELFAAVFSALGPVYRLVAG
jgi:phage N-6-adenine-methyltransferase